MEVAIVESADRSRNERTAESILRALPEWFGLEEPIRDYVRAAGRLQTFVASVGGEDVGFLTLERHFPTAAEILVMAVARDHHHGGVGRALVETAAASARSAGVRLLQVKTLGPSHPSVGYAGTRAFYDACGFLPLEELDTVWGQDNPCLILVRVLDA